MHWSVGLRTQSIVSAAARALAKAKIAAVVIDAAVIDKVRTRRLMHMGSHQKRPRPDRIAP